MITIEQPERDPGRAPRVEVPASHVAMVSHPDEVAGLIQMAAKAVPSGG